jgi:hypothetical protein
VDVEWTAVNYEFAPGGSPGHQLGGDEFGFAGPFVDAFPAYAEPMARAVKQSLHARCREKTTAVHYLGLYRTIEIEEIVPQDDPRVATERHAAYLRDDIMANESLTVVFGRVNEGFQIGGSCDGDFCAATRDCHPAPRWIDVQLEREGRPRLWDLTGVAPTESFEERERFNASTLAAARRLVAGQVGEDLSDLAVQREPGWLPEHSDDTVTFRLSVNVGGGAPREAAAFVPLSLREALRGDVVGRLGLESDVLGRVLASVNLRAQKVELDAHTQVVSLVARMRLSSAPVTMDEVVPMNVAVAVDGERVLVLGGVKVDPTWLKEHPGILDRVVSRSGDERAITVHLGVN